MPFIFTLVVLSPNLSTMKRFSSLQNVHLSHKNLHILKKLKTWFRTELKFSHEEISWKKRNRELMCFCFLADKCFPQQMKMAKPVHMGSQRILTGFFFSEKVLILKIAEFSFRQSLLQKISAQPIKHKKLSRFSKKLTYITRKGAMKYFVYIIVTQNVLLSLRSG